MQEIPDTSTAETRGGDAGDEHPAPATTLVAAMPPDLAQATCENEAAPVPLVDAEGRWVGTAAIAGGVITARLDDPAAATTVTAGTGPVSVGWTPATCKHQFCDAVGNRVYLYCQRGCGTRDPLEPAPRGGLPASGTLPLLVPGDAGDVDDVRARLIGRAETADGCVVLRLDDARTWAIESEIRAGTFSIGWHPAPPAQGVRRYRLVSGDARATGTIADRADDSSRWRLSWSAPAGGSVQELVLSRVPARPAVPSPAAAADPVSDADLDDMITVVSDLAFRGHLARDIAAALVELKARRAGAPAPDVAALLAEIAVDDARWPGPPWEPSVGRKSGRFDGVWLARTGNSPMVRVVDVAASGTMATDAERVELAEYIARLREREPRLVAALLSALAIGARAPTAEQLADPGLCARLAEVRDAPAQPLRLARAGDVAHVAELETALRDLIARVESTGGYASPEEQDVLRRARAALAACSDPRVGKRCRPGEWNGAVGRVEGVDPHGYLLVRGETWPPGCVAQRVRAADVQWVDDPRAPDGATKPPIDRWKAVGEMTAAAGPIPWSTPDGPSDLAEAARQWAAAEAAYHAALAESRAAHEAGAEEVEQLRKPGWWEDAAARERHRQILARHAAAAEQVEQTRRAEYAALLTLRTAARACAALPAAAAPQNGGAR